MNAMGHKTKTFIGARQSTLANALERAAPTAMAMGTTGMAEMAQMSMALPANTLPMMTGTGPFGGIEMGGMFTVVKVREGLAAGDYRDPGWYKHPPGTVAYEVAASDAGEPARQGGAKSGEPKMDMPKGHEHHRQH
jgi:hypothetical protein